MSTPRRRILALLCMGTQDFMAKPCSSDELRVRVDALLARKASADALRHSEAQLRELFVQASDGIFIADLDGRCTHVKRAACRRLGYAPDVPIGKTIADLIPPADVARGSLRGLGLASVRERLSYIGGAISLRSIPGDGTAATVEVPLSTLPASTSDGNEESQP